MRKQDQSPEGKSLKPLLIRLPDKLVKMLNRAAKREGVTRALLIRNCLENALDKAR